MRRSWNMKDSAIEETTEVTDTVMEASTKAAEVAETVVDEIQWIVDSVMEESTEIVVSEPVMEQATESEVVESAMEESSEPVVNSAETMVSWTCYGNLCWICYATCYWIGSSRIGYGRSHCYCYGLWNAQALRRSCRGWLPQLLLETTAIDMICESKVIESAEVSASEEAAESTGLLLKWLKLLLRLELLRLADEIMPSQYESVSHTFPERANLWE